ncbi:MAG: ankyrin repeat domain-containing protein, partial [Elusimicrobiaceae bacterium]|nr:ankyrin repeat domain-containing protein [Elusimicrobiaceae bacterium]
MFKKMFVFSVSFLFAVSAFADKGDSQKSKQNGKEKKYSYLYDTSLIQAIKKQDLDRVSFLLLANVSPNEKNDAQETPLSIAVTYPSEEIITKLLEKGAKVNEASFGGITPLMSSVAKGKVQIVDLLLEYGADANMQDDQGKTALMHAVENLNYDAVSSLLDLKKINLSITDKKGRTAFMYALESKDDDMSMLFLEKGIKINPGDKAVQKLFLKAVRNNDFTTADMLLEYG